MIDSGAIPGFPGLVGSRSQDESAAALETRLREVSFSAEVWYVLMVIDGQSLNPRKRADIRAVRDRSFKANLCLPPWYPIRDITARTSRWRQDHRHSSARRIETSSHLRLLHPQVRYIDGFPSDSVKKIGPRRAVAATGTNEMQVRRELGKVYRGRGLYVPS